MTKDRTTPTQYALIIVLALKLVVLVSFAVITFLHAWAGVPDPDMIPEHHTDAQLRD